MGMDLDPREMNSIRKKHFLFKIFGDCTIYETRTGLAFWSNQTILIVFPVLFVDQLSIARASRYRSSFTLPERLQENGVQSITIEMCRLYQVCQFLWGNTSALQTAEMTAWNSFSFCLYFPYIFLFFFSRLITKKCRSCCESGRASRVNKP